MTEDRDDNLAFRLTAPGAAALAVIRIVGPRVEPFLASQFSKKAAPSRCVHGELRDESNQIIDDPVIILGEDKQSADISLHGGSWVVQATLDLLERHGFSFVNDPPIELLHPQSTDETELKVLAALPRATTELGVRALLAQIDAWRNFTPTDAELELIQRDCALDHLLKPPTVAIVGPANAGKSTLANRLLAHDRSIVADLPGTTRDWVGERADLDGLPVFLIDTPGIRRSNDTIEQQAIARSGERVASADLVILVLDAARPLEPEQAPLIAQFPNATRIINKCDRPAAIDPDAVGGIRCVATRGEGVDQIIETIQRAFGVWQMDLSRPRLIPGTTSASEYRCK